MDWKGTLVGFILGMASAILGDKMKQWLSRPGIVVSFFPDDHCLRYSDAHVTTGANVFKTKSKFLRVKVANRRRFAGRGCRALLTSIRRHNADRPDELLLADTLPLRWAYLGFAPIDIPGHTRFYVDLISALQVQKQFTVELESQPLILAGATNERARYTFDVAIVGDNFDPVSIQIHLDWKQDWNFCDVWSESPDRPHLE